jgi:type IX secretion system PorP/SprF family membrane protein
MIKRVIIFITITCFISVYLKGQQTPLFTQFEMNKYMINPAAAGSGGYTSISLVAREQWVGFKGTPKTHTLAIDSRILGNSYILSKLSVRKKKPQKTRSGNTGWGAYFYNDLNGPIDRTGFNGTYSYHIELDNSQISFGLSFVFSQLKIQGEEFITADEVPDNLLTGATQSVWLPDANFGVFYTARDYYAGYSTMQLLNSMAQFGTKGTGKYEVERMHQIIGGYTYNLNDIIALSPSTLIKISEANGAQADFSIKCTYDKLYWGGISFRTGSAMAVYGGINYNKYYFGYAFDYSFGTIHKSNFGSHEFIVLVRIGDSARRYKWLNTY